MADPQKDPQPQEVTPSAGAEWSEPTMERVPRPTYWPVVMALGTVFIFWGVVTMWAISAIGLGLFALALVGWVREMCHAG